MDSTQADAQVDSRIAPAQQNPQSSGGQALVAPTSTLQSGSNVLGASSNATISSVGDSTFQPFDASNTSTSATTATAMATDRQYPVIIAAAMVILICIASVWLMARKSQQRLLGH